MTEEKLKQIAWQYGEDYHIDDAHIKYHADKSFYNGATSEAAKKYWEEKGWIFGDVPKDGQMIIRWHEIWKKPVFVTYNERFEYPWIDSLMSNTWPEESFVPNCYMLFTPTPPITEG